MKPNLLACPCCGSRAKFEDASFGPVRRDGTLIKSCATILWFAQCTNKECSLSVIGPSKQDAVRRWNTRKEAKA